MDVLMDAWMGIDASAGARWIEDPFRTSIGSSAPPPPAASVSSRPRTCSACAEARSGPRSPRRAPGCGWPRMRDDRDLARALRRDLDRVRLPDEGTWLPAERSRRLTWPALAA